MSVIILILVVGALAVLTLDTIGSIAARQFGFRYGSLRIISWLIWFGTGFFAARYTSVSLSPVAGGSVALIDATLGWYISWLIGPGRPKSEINGMRISKIISIVTLKGVALGLIGGLLA
jgi:hypothetical protein